MSKETRVRRMVRGSPVGVRHGPWRVGCQRYRLNHNRKVESSRQMVQIESASPPPTHCTAPTGPDSWPNTGEPELGRQSHGEESGSEGRERGCGGKEKQTKTKTKENGNTWRMVVPGGTLTSTPSMVSSTMLLPDIIRAAFHSPTHPRRSCVCECVSVCVFQHPHHSH
jgi:hypothetical protein